MRVRSRYYPLAYQMTFLSGIWRVDTISNQFLSYNINLKAYFSNELTERFLLILYITFANKGAILTSLYQG
jgi:hypothetical protein